MRSLRSRRWLGRARVESVEKCLWFHDGWRAGGEVRAREVQPAPEGPAHTCALKGWSCKQLGSRCEPPPPHTPRKVSSNTMVPRRQCQSRLMSVLEQIW